MIDPINAATARHMFQAAAEAYHRLGRAYRLDGVPEAAAHDMLSAQAKCRYLAEMLATRFSPDGVTPETIDAWLARIDANERGDAPPPRNEDDDM